MWFVIIVLQGLSVFTLHPTTQLIAAGLILGQQEGLNFNGDFNETQPPSHGLYLLGEPLPEDGFIQSISAFGEVICHQSDQDLVTHLGGLLKFFLLETLNDGGYTVKDYYDITEKCDNTIPGSINKFDNQKHPRKNNLIALYILNKPLPTNSNMTSWWHRLQVNLFSNRSKESNHYKFFQGSDNTNEKYRKSINYVVKRLLKDGDESSWKGVDDNLDFNVQVKIKFTSQKLSSKARIAYVVCTIVIFIFVITTILLLVLLCCKCRRNHLAVHRRQEEILLRDYNSSKADQQDQNFSDVEYLLQKDKEGAGKGRKMVININHYHGSEKKNSTLAPRAQPKHEYALLSQNHTYSPTTSSPPVLDDHDYDEPYFEPACKEEELLLQLRDLGVPIVAKEALTLLSDEFLGSGAFGTVYKGVWLHGELGSDQSVEEEVAVKTVEGGASEEDRVKFLQEAAIMGQFHHPNILRILGVITHNSCQVLTEIMKNGDLHKHLQNIKESTVDQELAPTLLSYSRHVANGMMYLAVKLFVHRDLAARNILVAEDGVCKIADFGFSRELRKEEDFYVSRGGKIPVKWTAPEALNYRKYSTASDVWSYGCVLYEIWSLGEKPYNDLTNEEVYVMMKKLSSGYRLPPPPGCPRDVYHIMIQCWNSDPLKRPSFMDITTLLQKPDFQVLKWSSEELTTCSEEARTLGVALEAGHQLHKDLQEKYF